MVDSEKCPGPSAFAEKVDLFFAVHGAQYLSKSLKSTVTKVLMTGVYLLDEPYEVDRTVQWARHYNYIFTVDRITLPVHQKYTKQLFCLWDLAMQYLVLKGRKFKVKFWS